MPNLEEAPLSGRDLVAWGVAPGKHMRPLIERANALVAEGRELGAVRAEILAAAPSAPDPVALKPRDATPFHQNIEAETEDEVANVEAVRRTMRELMRTPTIEAGAVMPDACPSGAEGAIPVGGVVAARNAIHPGMHSADICCSVMISDLGFVEPKAALDAGFAVTHFGAGGRRPDPRFETPKELLAAFRANAFLNQPKLLAAAQTHMGTQGDGNHFLFVGRSRATGRTHVVTHHGSRGPGALLYKAGMAAAEAVRRELSPETRKENAWLVADSEQGRAYWAALQLVRAWTKRNHAALHAAAAGELGVEIADQYWNEHNFVFKRGELYFHGKGATPAFDGWADDATERTLIPLNMAAPVLVARGKDRAHALGFSPHGAGRNFSRAEHRRRHEALAPAQMMARETQGLDIRSFGREPDVSELPSAYKSAEAVERQIKAYDLAEIEDYIDPFGCVMAGYLPPPWLKPRAEAPSARESD